jgi:purine-binding chemotaxis protein CheW
MSDIDMSNQFVTFRIENELYAINVFKSREILEVPDITKVPGMPEMIRGVINIRGEVVPVLDLKMKFNNVKTDFKQDTAIIITEIQSKEDVIPIGIIVDSAREVITLEADQVEPPPQISVFIDNKYILGMGKIDENFIIILNIDQILSDKELFLLNQVEEE